MGCAEFDVTDVVRFVAPTVRNVRSHGANRMVNDVKVKYPGYVFAKLRLCKPVYETIQGLDLCRSWMGTVNHRGYKKLPPAPLALNEDEIAKFGLEDDNVDSGAPDGPVEAEGDDGVILDSPEMDELDRAHAIDPKEIKVYRGLKVEDMVKVTASNKFHNEDGVVRRLKGGKILVRFYTYGSMYEEWLAPGDVRKMSSVEILRGLAGPSQPITQRDLEGQGGGAATPLSSSAVGPRRTQLQRSNDGLFQQAFGSSPSSQRNRKQDRTANRFRNDRDAFDERSRNDRNWNWYQEQQQQRPKRSISGSDVRSSQMDATGLETDGGYYGRDPLRDVDGQWGRTGKPLRDSRELPKNRFGNRRAQSAINGQDDWSSYVSSSTGSAAGSLASSSRSAAESGGGRGGEGTLDDFFDSLMDNLSKDLGSSSRSEGDRALPSARWDTAQKPTVVQRKRNDKSDNSNDDDFFASFLSDLASSSGEAAAKKKLQPREPSRVRTTRSTLGDIDDPVESSEDDDVFSAFLSDLDRGSASSRTSSSTIIEVGEASSLSLAADNARDGSATNGGYDNDADGFFTSLEAELRSAAALSDSYGDGDEPTGDTRIAEESDGAREPRRTRKVEEKKAASSAPERATPGGTSTLADLEKLTVPALKEMLKERGLKVTGKKAELIERLSVGTQ
jgi:transcription antitermination factor NusG